MANNPRRVTIRGIVLPPSQALILDMAINHRRLNHRDADSSMNLNSRTIQGRNP